MFLGEHQHTLDAKGRVSLPAKFRSEMTAEQSLVVARGLDGCLYVYSSEAYDAFTTELLTRQDFDPRIRKMRRFFMSGATPVELDSAGRIGIPSVLREYAGLSKDVTVIGNGTRIEIWDAGTWAAYNDEAEGGSVEDLAQELAEAGLL
jgi:MraZ protein